VLARKTGLKPGKPLARGKGLSRSSSLKTVTTLKRSAPKRAAPKNTGFSEKVKLAVRKRAGNGDPDQACCEACGIWLGCHGGQVQHIVARLMGGRGRKAPWWFQTAANGALLCGTPQTGDHGLCEVRDPQMGAMGFWLPSSANALTVPMMLHGAQGGVLVWRSADGRYLLRAPEGAEAA
jgi:hypothetical protein